MDDRQDQIDALLRGLRKLPRHRGLSFRGLPEPVRGPERGVTVSSTIVATSLDARIATENFTSPALAAIVGELGRAVHVVPQRPSEHEVAFLPATMFLRLRDVSTDHGLIAVDEQLDPDREPGTEPDLPWESQDDLGAAITQAVADARARPEVPIASTGKFVGDLL